MAGEAFSTPIFVRRGGFGGFDKFSGHYSLLVFYDLKHFVGDKSACVGVFLFVDGCVFVTEQLVELVGVLFVGCWEWFQFRLCFVVCNFR